MRTIVAAVVLLVCCTGFELESEESTLPNHLDAVVPQGKRLKLKVENVFHPGLRWRFNGAPVSEKCEVTIANSASTLICNDMDWVDSGLYEYQAVSADGRKETMLSVNVTVAECTEELAARQRQEQEARENQSPAPEAMDECFCSGITQQCHKAGNLYWSQLVVNVTEADMVDLKISNEDAEESWNVDSEPESWTYYSLPKEFTRSLVRSYGGYFDFPTNDDGIDEDGPDVVLKGKHYTLVYHNRRELLSQEVSRSKVLMTEDSWRQLNGKVVPKYVFMMVLSNVRAFYVKCNQYRRLEPQEMRLDSADEADHGLGAATTIEECNCRTGYRGLSCESCARGYYRRYAVGIQGICVSIKEKWESIKASRGWKHKLEQVRTV